MTDVQRRLFVAITGASGVIYGKRLVEILARLPVETHVTVSAPAARVFDIEMKLSLDPANGESVLAALAGPACESLIYHSPEDVGAPPASGSFRLQGMAIVPCSSGTLGRIASGVSTSLIERAADVCLKERRRLVLVPRETPLSRIQLENMLRVTDAGAIVLPACPGFYGHAAGIQDLVDFVVGRVLDHLGVEHDLVRRYGESNAPAAVSWED